MLFKIIFVFLAAMVLIAMIGKALFPSRFSKILPKRRKPPVCGSCGRYLIGRKSCDCKETG